MNPNWLRVSKAHPCPICGKPDWCSVSRDGMAVICPRIQEGSVRWVGAGGGGYLHRIGDGALDRQLPHRVYRRPVGDSTAGGAQTGPLGQQAPPVDFERLQDVYFFGLEEPTLISFATRLNVAATALSRLGVGWAPGNAYSFPMRTPNGAVVGIRLRRATGRPWCITGSQHGLFVDRENGGEGPVFVCEGESDTASMLGLGLEAVGVPGAGTCISFLKNYLRRRDVVVMVDRDEAGERGADRIAAGLGRVCRSVRLMYPRCGKDVREWFTLSHPTAEMVLAAARARRCY